MQNITETVSPELAWAISDPRKQTESIEGYIKRMNPFMDALAILRNRNSVKSVTPSEPVVKPPSTPKTGKRTRTPSTPIDGTKFAGILVDGPKTKKQCMEELGVTAPNRLNEWHKKHGAAFAIEKIEIGNQVGFKYTNPVD